ncbi:ABC transporter ATP-binding protein [Vibrio agarivorans]|uniref:ABC transporter ATP-binding protein n=1 Tax=Vibrio agarivorans TaxID=153622 RepID=UPI002231FD22|nr:dipeptide/oligopeptide/nickel ABC transporter ATP-binding protein [Vibrio agarivorans]
MNTHSHSTSAQVHFDNVSVHYHSRPTWLGGEVFKALSQLNLHIDAKNLAIVGPSGAGKSTLIELLFGLRKPSLGEIYVCDYPLSTLTNQQRQKLCKHIQLVPQEPHTSLNPYFTVREILTEPLINLGFGGKHESKLVKTIADVGLHDGVLDLYPRQLSVGQAQRVAIARALVVEPCVLVADEPTSSLDPINRQNILELIKTLQRDRNMLLILVTHDLAAANTLCDEILVLDKGEMVEHSPTQEMMTNPKHEISHALLKAQNLITA